MHIVYGFPAVMMVIFFIGYLRSDIPKGFTAAEIRNIESVNGQRFRREKKNPVFLAFVLAFFLVIFSVFWHQNISPLAIYTPQFH